MKLLIVDDSAFMRTSLTAMFRDAGGWDVHTAKNGADALAVIREIDPDVVTLDVNMPVMDGLTCLSHIMTESPRPVVMLSSLTVAGAMATLEALHLGAVDVIAKPGGTISVNVRELRGEIVQRVAEAARAHVRAPGKPRPVRPAPRTEPTRPPTADTGLVLIGASTGGPRALEDILTALPGDFPDPILIAQHMPDTFTGALARRLSETCAIRVVEVANAAELIPGRAVIARGDHDVIVTRRPGGGLTALSKACDPQFRWHPSIDRMVSSAAEVVAADRLIAIQLTGIGDDGAAAMAAVKARGGRTIAESGATAVVFGMPRALAERGGASAVLPLHEIAGVVMQWTTGRTRRWA